MAGLAFLADELTGSRHFLRQALVGADDFIQSLGDLAFDAFIVAGQAHREVAVPHCLQGFEQAFEIELGRGCFAIGRFGRGATTNSRGGLHSTSSD
jgi:hypothetical protein